MSKTVQLSKYLFFFIVFYILHCATIQSIQPFAFGLLFALVWCNQKIYILSPLYILSGLLANFQTSSLIIHTITCLVFILAYFLHYKFKKRLNPLLIGVYAFLSQFGNLYINSVDTYLFVNSIICLILGLICMYAYLHLLQGIAKKGIKKSYTIDEIICLAIFCFALGSGLWCMPFGKFITLGVLAFVILLTCFVFGNIHSLLLTTFISLGIAFTSNQFLYLSHFIFLSLAVCATKCNNRAYSCLSLILIDILSGLYFLPLYDLNHLASIFIGTLLFICIPQRYISQMHSFVIKDKEDYGARTMINNDRQKLCNRLYELSEAFLSLKNLYFESVKEIQDIEIVSVYLVEDVKQNNCYSCPHSNQCLSLNFKEINSSLNHLIKLCYSRGRVSIVEATPHLTSICKKSSCILTSINQIVEKYKNNIKLQTNLDNSRLILSEQMWGVSQIMKSLAKELSLSISFNSQKENQIKEDLSYAGIVCSEVIIYENKNIMYITLVVNNNDINNKNLTKIVSKTVGQNMEVISTNNSEKAGFSVLNLKNSNLFDIVFGSARAMKANSKSSGDTHSVLKINDDKILLSLCDGMGSGPQAEKTSALSLGLIENFYKAGFDHNLILNNVNRLISSSGKETFSALDICIFNLHSGICDIIKIGSPATFIKSENSTSKLDANALPLGILEELQPNIVSKVLNDNDMIILLTDGITDSFSSIEELKQLINETDTQNPQILANTILNKALSNYKNIPKDDMTVLIGKIYKKF